MTQRVCFRLIADLGGACSFVLASKFVLSFTTLTHGAAEMSAEVSSRSAPTIIITGTPGTGKTTHAQLLAEESPIPLKHINVGDLVKEKGLYEEYDEEWQSYTVDEDRVRDPFLRPIPFSDATL